MSPPLPPVLQPISIGSYIASPPEKRILTNDDLQVFHNSPAYSLITSFIIHLNASVCPLDSSTNKLNEPEDFITSSESYAVSPEVDGITRLVNHLSDLVNLAPPDSGPRRFGNVAFRKWLQLVVEHDADIEQYIPAKALPGKSEALHYLKNSFGSGERLDYGTGHELSFAAFLCCIWILGGFEHGRDEKALVLRTFNAYFKLVRKLVTTYNLEPAGSHGVWGLDDHSFLPYIFGSAQLTTFRPTSDTQAAEANAKAEEANLPKPADVVKLDIVNRERNRNLYFDAIGFIYDVKTGPFWEHSPILYDISGVQKGWGKINEGMLKMYDKEVLGKFPVVQHFRFGSIFKWPSTSQNLESSATKKTEMSGGSAPPIATTRAPWASSSSPATPQPAVTRAPWITDASSRSTPLSSPQPAITRAPWAAPQPPAFPTSAGMSSAHPPPILQLDGLDTKAPWADPGPGTPKKGEDREAEGANVRTEAQLGPRRTSSPDSARAQAMGGASCEDERRGSIGTGGVRVAETGDLSGRRPSRTR
ncbi:hypothetical protein FN846DRAFT_774321 [Sphaerosporella brunnea]|uniref:Serine/threonine-protein phosphatase 2A activator n=1 Tax=Sphaerosporella brunnea TaxID=1250544 RepID=A0A5J5F4K2_9PEZI|nr:hypothetical protein FN846DRAFT_774321 [Sphaerosporella brunnea]